jgi:uncharacterized protein
VQRFPPRPNFKIRPSDLEETPCLLANSTWALRLRASYIGVQAETDVHPDIFKALGFSQNPQFTNDAGACIVVSNTISVMLLTHVRFRDEVDSLVAKAIAAGGSTYDEPEDFGFMYTHSFVDLDGHGWGLFHMSAMPAQK